MRPKKKPRRLPGSEGMKAGAILFTKSEAIAVVDRFAQTRIGTFLQRLFAERPARPTQTVFLLLALGGSSLGAAHGGKLPVASGRAGSGGSRAPDRMPDRYAETEDLRNHVLDILDCVGDPYRQVVAQRELQGLKIGRSSRRPTCRSIR